MAIALTGSGIGTGIVFASQLTRFVRSNSGDDAWRTVYLVQGIIAVVVLVATFAFVGHAQDRPIAQRAGFGGFQVLRRMRGWVPLTLAYTSFGFMYLLVLAFLTSRLEDDSGWTPSRASLAFTALGIASVFGGPTFAALSRRIGPRLALAVAFTSWSVVTLIVLPGWFAPSLAASAALGLLFGGIPTMITLYVVDNTSTADYGASYAAATLAFGLAQMLAPQLGGLVADLAGSFTVVFLLSAGLALTGTVSALRLPRSARQGATK